MMLLIGKNRNSFTLLELLLVVLIISIVLGLNMPAIRKSISSSSFKSFVNKAYLLLDYAKTQAVLKGNILEADYYSGSRILGIKRFNTEESQGPGIVVPGGLTEEDFLHHVDVPENIAVDIDKAEKIIFYPDGTMTEFSMSIKDKKSGKDAVIESQGFDGKITVEPIVGSP